MTIVGNRAGRTALGTAAMALLLLVASLPPALVARAQDATPAGGDVAPYEEPENIGDLEGEIVADGSSTVGPITEAVAEEFSAIAGNVDISVDISGTGGGFERFCGGETDIQNASRAIEEDEIAACADAGVEYYEFEVAFDALTVVVSEANEFLTCISVESLATLWAPDSQVTTFDQLNPAFPAEEIALYGPGTDSGTYDYFRETILGEGPDGEPLDTRSDYTASEDDNVLVEGVAGDENALGYFGYAYYIENEDSLNAVAIAQSSDLSDCVAPSPETVQDGSYVPLSRPLYVYVRAESLERPDVQEFLRFYLANAQELVADVGFVNSPVESYVEDQQKLEAAIAGQGTPDSASTPEA